MPIRIRLLGLGLASLLGAEAMASTPLPPRLSIRCSATGAKLLTPPMTPAAACERFIGKIPGAHAAPSSGALRDGLVVELRFLPNGMAGAHVTRFRAGAAQPQQRFELAISDRKFQPGDVDRLAADVTTGMAIK